MRTKRDASVSVIVPCFRCGETIERAIESVYRQTSKPMEIIIIDDASDDDSLAILHQLQKRYGPDWITVIKLETNLGQAAARNIGWDAAQYDYVAFLDADDSWHDDKTRIQYSWMQTHPYVVMTGNAREEYGALSISSMDKENILAPYKKSPLTKELRRNNFPTSSVMLRRNINYRFDNLRYGEDKLLWIRLCADYDACYRSEQILTYRYKKLFGDGGVTGNM